MAKNFVRFRASERLISYVEKLTKKKIAVKTLGSERRRYRSKAEQFAFNFDGILGEIVLARFYGVSHDAAKVHAGGDAGHDLLVNDVKVNAKLSRWSWPRLFVSVEEAAKPSHSDLYVLLRYKAFSREITIFGQKWYEDVLESKIDKVNERALLNHITLISELDEIERKPMLVPGWLRGVESTKFE